MRHSSRVLVGALLTTVGLVGAMVTPATALGQTAGASAVVDSSSRVRVEGTILVLAGDKGVHAAQTVTPLADEVRLLTSNGEYVVLTGALTDDATTGSAFAGTVAIPADAVEDINAVVEEALGETAPPVAVDTVDGESAVGGEILAASATLDAPLAVVEATITTEALGAGQIATAHTLDVVVATLPDDPSESVMSDAAIGTMTATLSKYWASQSAGQVASISKPAAVQRLVSANACDPDAELIWEEAAALFGTTHESYWNGSSAEHLVVIAPESCGGGSGLGSVGSLTDGGIIWASHFNVLATSTMAHEFGHNLGLEHSNASVCTTNAYEGGNCVDAEYEDFYDIMGGGLYYTDESDNYRSNSQLMALNVTQKSRLGALTTSDLPSVKLTAGSPSKRSGFTLMPASAASGLRGLKVTDPRNGQVYFVEYRSGTGMDSGSLYASGLFSTSGAFSDSGFGLGIGVRVLKLRADGTSSVLRRPNVDPLKRPLFIKAAQAFVTASGGLTVAVTGTGATAALTVSLVAKVLTTAPVPTISGTKKVGSLLTANAGTWGPGTVTLAYQWYRTGVPITGATAKTYKLGGADAGKTMTVKVTGSQAAYGNASRTSAATAAVAPGTLTTATPTITGTKKVGYTLTAGTGTWGPGTVTLRYKWYRSGVLITGATAKTHKLVAADLGKKMTVRVTGSKTGYTSASKVSAATTAVVRGTLVHPTPTVSGTMKVGYTLTAHVGTWGPGTVKLTYRWYRSGVAIPGAAAATYKLVSADRNDTLQIRVTGVKSGYTSYGVLSAATVKIG